jgi:hypothetical protein
LGVFLDKLTAIETQNTTLISRIIQERNKETQIFISDAEKFLITAL